MAEGNAHATGVVLLAVVLVSSCGAERSEESCRIAGDGKACEGSVDCCPPVTGRRVFLDRACTEPDQTALACYRVPGSGGGCVANGQLGCVTRTVNGTREVFITPSTWSTRTILVGFAECDSQLRTEAERISAPCR